MRLGATLLLLALPALAAPDPKVELGRRLFMDPTVSRSGRVSCSSCHLPEHGFSDPRVLSPDEGGDTLRHSMSCVDVADGRPLHWDGEFADVRELLVARLGSIVEGIHLSRAIRKRQFDAAKAAGRHPDEDDFLLNGEAAGYGGGTSTGPDRAVSARPGHRPFGGSLRLRLDEDHRYEEAFRAAFGSPRITTDHVIDALAAYVLSLRSGESPFDRFVAGETGALTDAQRRGLAHFTGKAGCAACHVTDGARPRLTDGGFHNTGVAFAEVEQAKDGEPTLRGILLEIAREGARGISFVREDARKFKTPSLRDVARRGPYMHDGSLATLEDVVRYYDRGAIANEGLDERIRPLGLSEDETRELVAFLGALSGDERPGVGPLPAKRSKLRVRVVDLSGKPIPGLRVEIRPAGDRLEGGRIDDPSQLVVTNGSGCISFVPPKWTHVLLTSVTHEIHYDWLIPDCAPPMEVIAAPRDTVALKLRIREKPPDALLALWAGSNVVLARFRLVQRMSPTCAVYVADRRPSGPRWLSAVLTRTEYSGRISGCSELDLSGGWTDPFDGRPDPDRERK